MLDTGTSALWKYNRLLNLKTNSAFSMRPIIGNVAAKVKATFLRILGGLALSCLVCCGLSRFCCHGHSILLSSYLCGIKQENSSCSICEILLTSFWIVPHLSLICRAVFFTTSIFDLWSRLWGVALLLGLRGVPLCFHPSKRVG